MPDGTGAERSDRKLCLLLTATIAVRGVSARSDPSERLEDYRWALGRWTARNDIDGLVLVENSGHDLEALRSVAGASPLAEQNVELLSFDGQVFPTHLGKGYGETLNIEHALRESKLLAASDTLIVRVNGRNYVENIDAFFRAARTADILCDFKQMLTWADGRILAGTRRFFEDYACPYGREVDDSKGYYYEHALARAIHGAMADGLTWSPFPEPPRVSGVSGTSNKELRMSPLVRTGREVQHKVKLRMLRL